jgi:hypothetical protein
LKGLLILEAVAEDMLDFEKSHLERFHFLVVRVVSYLVVQN